MKVLSSIFSAVALLASSCGVVEKSTYNVGKYQGAGSMPGNVSAETAKGSSENQTSKTPLKSEKIKEELIDATVATGLTPCVKTAFEANNTVVFSARKIDGDVADWQKKASLNSNEEMWSAYDVILRNTVSAESGLVNYSALQAGGAWNGLWTAFVAKLSSASLPNGANSEEALAFWVNSYNAIMIDILVNDASAISNGIKRNFTFGNTRRSVGGFNVTLNEIEYGVLKLNQKNQANPIPEAARPANYEPRLHFALVCGAVSCPKLRNFAYDPAQTFTILNENAHMFFNDSVNHVVADSSSGAVRVSELFKWFFVDFNSMRSPSNASANSEFLLNECRSDSALVSSFFGGIGTFKNLSGSQIIPYNWSVNESK
jgi:hypothetical protein